MGGASQDGPIAPDVWVNEGDMDGDGLRDEFELRNGLDPNQAASFADGTFDEDRLDAGGKTMFEVQKAEAEAAAAGGEGGSGGKCGLTGMETLLVLGLLALRRRR